MMMNGFSFLLTFFAGVISNIWVIQNVFLIIIGTRNQILYMAIINRVVSVKSLPSLSPAVDDFFQGHRHVFHVVFLLYHYVCSHFVVEEDYVR